ncbi:MAG TPA: hypothetical protein VK595_08860 [Vicinamibacterales bacterium]|nr:hypothetical protein [Vicinamibacterales bacterium]
MLRVDTCASYGWQTIFPLTPDTVGSDGWQAMLPAQPGYVREVANLLGVFLQHKSRWLVTRWERRGCEDVEPRKNLCLAPPVSHRGSREPRTEQQERPGFRYRRSELVRNRLVVALRQISPGWGRAIPDP